MQSAVAAAVSVMVKEPAPATTFFIVAVVSFWAMVQSTCEFAVHSELVTTTEVAPDATMHCPADLLIVTAPTVEVLVKSG